jgi:hypothetical protein
MSNELLSQALKQFATKNAHEHDENSCFRELLHEIAYSLLFCIVGESKPRRPPPAHSDGHGFTVIPNKKAQLPPSAAALKVRNHSVFLPIAVTRWLWPVAPAEFGRKGVSLVCILAFFDLLHSARSGILDALVFFQGVIGHICLL